ncbi:hypothetical protein DPSP01_003252 [Paraphaeosphaeria sporulosa]|uniref:Small ribosomal subunit protein uS7m n=1 Tax=Paraphaeosphaeria sporulosa TaxID=1460663 RepID=A0A177CZH0_9PLEO|nr:30S ribosomal protein-like protein S7 [Paraphaeosphaeria sporulosa]OAG12069.1 30S ribosomal protein-like protein S7 [Paraphaeosphaeria sporulosa]
MPPRLNVLSLARAIPYRPKGQAQWLSRPAARLAPTQTRTYSDAKDEDKVPAADRSKRIDAKPLGHVSEEASAMADITGGEGPDLSQGTPVQDIVRGDKKAEEKLPKVMKEQLKSNASSAPKGSRSYSTSTTPIGGGSGAFDMGLMSMTSPPAEAVAPGLKFEMPVLPLPKDGHLKHRYDPVVDQVTNLLMRHGMKSVAQRNMALILQQLRTASVPTINPQRPLLPGAPPPSHLPLNPVLYLTLAIDSVSPLLRIRNMKGAAGGGVALPIPVPLGQRQRRRTAIQWILGAASKRKTNTSGKTGYAQRVASEIISVIEGRSSVWDRRNMVHKAGISARANIVLPRKR